MLVGIPYYIIASKSPLSRAVRAQFRLQSNIEISRIHVCCIWLNINILTILKDENGIKERLQMNETI